MKTVYTKVLARGIISALAITMVIMGSFAVAPEASAQATATRTVLRGEFEPYVKVSAGGILKERVYYDVVTATKVCNLLGYNSGQAQSYSNWDSSSNNTAAYWNGSAWIQNQGARPGYMDAVRCTGLTATVPPVTATCTVNPSQVGIGDSMTFSVNASGGNGTYAYLWSGTNNLTGTGQSISKVYTTAGTKTATVRITSGGQSQTITCTGVVTPAVVYPAVSGTCTVNNSQPAIGDTVIFTANATGGNGNYTYSWSGTNNLSGNGVSTSIIYPTAGTKNASVIITSNGKSVTRNCSTVVRNVTVPPTQNGVTAYCTANYSQANIGDAVTFTASATGGNGYYTYSWTGTDGISGNGSSISRVFSYPGTKTATVTIYSNGQSITRNCTTYVNDYNYNNYYNYNNNNYNGLYATCSANPSTAYTGDTVNWYVSNVTGGNGYYTYSWTGTDGLYGSGNSVSKNYSTAGWKNATVTIYSNGQSITQNCSISIIDRYYGYNNNYSYIPPTTYTNYTYTDPYANYNYSSNGGVSLTLDQSTPGSGYVALSHVPYTGLADTTKAVLLVVGLAFWSFVIAYIFVIKHRRSEA